MTSYCLFKNDLQLSICMYIIQLAIFKLNQYDKLNNQRLKINVFNYNTTDFSST